MSKWPSMIRFLKNKPICTTGIIAAILLLYQGGVLAEPAWASSVEYRVKAAFLYNFTKFVEWPTHGGGTGKAFQIGILGEDLFGSEIEGLAGKAVGDRILKVNRYPGWNDRAANCDILFISKSQERDLKEIIRRLNGSPVLTIGDSTDYARRGVIINFFMEDNKVRFGINLKQAQRAGFKISSRLLKLAVILEDADK